MNTETKQIIDQALLLPAFEKAQIVDRLISSLDKPDETILNTSYRRLKWK